MRREAGKRPPKRARMARRQHRARPYEEGAHASIDLALCMALSHDDPTDSVRVMLDKPQPGWAQAGIGEAARIPGFHTVQRPNHPQA